MGAFVADGVVEPLNYSLKPFVELEGVVAEPSSDQLEAFQGHFQTMQSAVAAARAAEGGGELPSLAGMYRELIAATSEFCSGTPSVEDLSALPLRVLNEFVTWLMGEFAGPKATPSPS